MSFKRDENGLIEGVEYVYLPDGRINWRAMIPSEYLVINDSEKDKIVAKYGKPLREINPHDLEDRQLLILLGGIKHVLRIRGFKSVHQKVEYCDQYKSVNTCTIEFTPNFETGGESLIFSDTASASVDSTSGVFRLFIESIAANRAFVRCVRNALGINITGKDEFDERANKSFSKLEPQISEPEVTSFAPYQHLENLCKSLDKDGSHSFEKIKQRAIELKTSGDANIQDDPNLWTSFSSISDNDSYVLSVKIRNKKKA